MKVQELDNPAAGTWSRDCELIHFSLQDDMQLLYYKDEDRTHWEVEIWGIIAYKYICEEFSNVGYLEKLPVEGAFYEILDSPWVEEFEVFLENNKYGEIKHFVLQFYDETLEFLAQTLIFKPVKERPPGIEHISFQKWDDQGRPIPD